MSSLTDSTIEDRVLAPEACTPSSSVVKVVRIKGGATVNVSRLWQVLHKSCRSMRELQTRSDNLHKLLLTTAVLKRAHALCHGIIAEQKKQNEQHSSVGVSGGDDSVMHQQNLEGEGKGSHRPVTSNSNGSRAKVEFCGSNSQCKARDHSQNGISANCSQSLPATDASRIPSSASMPSKKTGKVKSAFRSLKYGLLKKRRSLDDTSQSAILVQS
eukprot:m.21701 g.21701  ORF g.21701 m.21701 type:complete len:214 (-) comp12508_c1_seq1:328-969(-)